MKQHTLIVYIIILFLMLENNLRAQTLEKLFGPTGCDATALIKDSKGVFWIGTGSSGGVYYFSEDENMWIAQNDGIGPVHITNLLEYENTMFCEVNYETLFYLNQTGAWEQIPEKSTNLIKSEITSAGEINRQQTEKLFYQLSAVNKSIEIEKLYFNRFVTINNTLFILDKRGLYYLDTFNFQVIPIEDNGLIASDIYQISIVNSDSVMVWTNAFELWLLKEKQWERLYKLPYNISKETFSLSYFIEHPNNNSSNEGKPISERSIAENSSIEWVMQNGIFSINNGKICIAVNGKLYTNINNQLCLIENLANEYSMAAEGVFVNDSTIYVGFLTNKKDYSGEIIIRPTKMKVTSIKPDVNDIIFSKCEMVLENSYNSFESSKIPNLVVDNQNRIVFNGEMLSFTKDEISYSKLSFESYSIFSRTLTKKSKVEIGNGIIMSNYRYLGHGDEIYYKYYKLNFPDSTLKPENEKFISTATFENNTFLGTCGSGLFLYKTKKVEDNFIKLARRKIIKEIEEDVQFPFDGTFKSKNFTLMIKQESKEVGSVFMYKTNCENIGDLNEQSYCGKLFVNGNKAAFSIENNWGCEFKIILNEDSLLVKVTSIDKDWNCSGFKAMQGLYLKSVIQLPKSFGFLNFSPSFRSKLTTTNRNSIEDMYIPIEFNQENCYKYYRLFHGTR